MFQSFEMLTGLPITSPSRVTPLRPPTIGGPLLDTHVHRITPYTQSQTPYCFFFVKLLFPFYLFPMFFLSYLCETCSVVDLFLSEASKTHGLLSLLYWTQASCWSNLAPRLSFGMRHLKMFKHFEVICCLISQKLPWKQKQQVYWFLLTSLYQTPECSNISSKNLWYHILRPVC